MRRRSRSSSPLKWLLLAGVVYIIFKNKSGKVISVDPDPSKQGPVILNQS